MGKTIVYLARWMALLAGALALGAYGAAIDGTIVVKRRLTKPKVTLEAGAYARGVPARLERAPPENALSWERSHVAIFLEGALPAWKASGSAEQPAMDQPSMEQKQRAFVPDMLVVPAGAEVSFPNLDPIFHNVFSLSAARSFDLGNYPKNQTRTVKMTKPGIVLVNCRLHPNMSGTIVVTPNAWATRAGEDGRFELPDAPPGKYTVVAWHKTAGFFRKEVEIDAGHGASVEFLIPLEAADEDRGAGRVAEHR